MNKGILTFQGLGVEGWLSNQMFQIAVTIATALENNMAYVLPTWKYSSYYKEQFPQLTREEIETIQKEILGEKNFHYDPLEIPNPAKNYSLTGYWQSFKYMGEHKDFVLSHFEPKDEIVEKIKNDWGEFLNQNTCAIHLRAGDYQNFPAHHPICDMYYYSAAMDKMPSDSIYLVFSDEPELAKQMFKGKQFVHVDYCDKTRGGDVILEHILMSMCKNIITANSTFSLWAAILNKNPDKIVVSPKKWFGSALGGYNLSDLYVPNSIII